VEEEPIMIQIVNGVDGVVMLVVKQIADFLVINLIDLCYIYHKINSL
jgi:hypothetical protein